MVYSSRRIGLLGGLINTGTRAAGHLWTRVQAHPWSDQSTSRPGCATWPAPAAPTKRLEPVPRFPLRPPRPHRSLGHTPLTVDHALRGAGPRSTSRAQAVVTRRSVRWRSASAVTPDVRCGPAPVARDLDLLRRAPLPRQGQTLPRQVQVTQVVVLQQRLHWVSPALLPSSIIRRVPSRTAPPVRARPWEAAPLLP